jgi:hypothetical protein
MIAAARKSIFLDIVLFMMIRPLAPSLRDQGLKWVTALAGASVVVAAAPVPPPPVIVTVGATV